MRRDDVLPPDAERIAHEAEHGEEEEDALDQSDGRDMEALEGAMGGLGAKGGERNGGLREEALLVSLEARVAEVEGRVLASA